jgi:hypothetical protein
MTLETAVRSRSAHPTGLVAANAVAGARIASAMIVFLMFSSCFKLNATDISDGNIK